MTKEIIYEPHPVSKERRESLIKKGYKIIDARFAPADYVHPDSKKAPRKKVTDADS